MKDSSDVDKHIEEKSKINDEKIELYSLVDSDRIKLVQFCREKIESLRPTFYIDTNFVSWIYRATLCFLYGDEATQRLNFEKNLKISPFIFTIGKHILETKSKKPGLFRKLGSNYYSKQAPKDMQSGYLYDYRCCSIIDNANVFKSYIRCIMKGLFSVNVSNNILILYKEGKHESMICKPCKSEAMERAIFYIQKYLPLTLDETRYSLLKLIFQIFDHFKQIIEVSGECIKEIAKIFAPNLFPSECFRGIEDYILFSEIIEIMYYSGIDSIDGKLYREYKKSNIFKWKK